MEIRHSEKHEQFRLEVRSWLEEHLPQEVAASIKSWQKVPKNAHVEWQKILAKKGWLAPAWPEEYGGPGWDPIERLIFDEEANRLGMPRANVPGIDLLGPSLIAFGTAEQKQRFLPPILASEHWWCQGFSEAGAGSDLANLSTRAVREDEDFIINGTKLWTSHAQHANWIMVLARTSIEERKQAGISFLLVDMDQPGVTVRPILTLGGVHVVNEVVLEDARCPVRNLLGKEGGAWDVTKFLLGTERIVGAWLGMSSEMLRQLKALIERELVETVSAALRRKVARIEIEMAALRLSAIRVLEDEMAGKPPGLEISVIKLKGSEVQQELTELLVEAVGPLAMIDPINSACHDGELMVPDDMAWLSQQFLDRRKLTIYGGAREIQRNIIARSLLRS